MREPARRVPSPPTATAGTSLLHLPFERGVGGTGPGQGDHLAIPLPFHPKRDSIPIPFPSPVQVCWAAHDNLIPARSGRETHFVPAWEPRARSSGSLNKQFDRTTRLCRGVRRTHQQRARTPPLSCRQAHGAGPCVSAQRARVRVSGGTGGSTEGQSEPPQPARLECFHFWLLVRSRWDLKAREHSGRVEAGTGHRPSKRRTAWPGQPCPPRTSPFLQQPLVRVQPPVLERQCGWPNPVKPHTATRHLSLPKLAAYCCERVALAPVPFHGTSPAQVAPLTLFLWVTGSGCETHMVPAWEP